MTTTTSPSDEALAQQGPSLLSGRRLRTNAAPPLYRHSWPPVAQARSESDELRAFVASSRQQQREILAGVRADPDRYGALVHGHLANLYADCFGYRDSPVADHTDDGLEVARFAARLELERELFEDWIEPAPVPELSGQDVVADHLDALAADNPGVHHPLFAFLRDEATRSQLETFLHCDLIRNEVVDDEVALLVVGLQGMQKVVAAANLWDEVGRGRLENLHTYWLRRLLEASDGWERLARERPGHPWFTKITSNVFTGLLTRASRKQHAFGCFLVFESWVEPHFRAILEGMRRVGMTADDLTIYFAAHVAIDPRHSQELSEALRLQQPPLSPRELAEVVAGAHLAAAAGRRQFDHMLAFLSAQA